MQKYVFNYIDEHLSPTCHLFMIDNRVDKLKLPRTLFELYPSGCFKPKTVFAKSIL